MAVANTNCHTLRKHWILYGCCIRSTVLTSVLVQTQSVSNIEYGKWAVATTDMDCLCVCVCVFGCFGSVWSVFPFHVRIESSWLNCSECIIYRQMAWASFSSSVCLCEWAKSIRLDSLRKPAITWSAHHVPSLPIHHLPFESTFY